MQVCPERFVASQISLPSIMLLPQKAPPLTQPPNPLQLPLEQGIPLALNKFTGQLAEPPVQNSVISHSPTDALHNVEDELKIFVEHDAEVPEQNSAMSHIPEEARQRVLELL